MVLLFSSRGTCTDSKPMISIEDLQPTYTNVGTTKVTVPAKKKEKKETNKK